MDLAYILRDTTALLEITLNEKIIIKPDHVNPFQRKCIFHQCRSPAPAHGCTVITSQYFGCHKKHNLIDHSCGQGRCNDSAPPPQ